MFLFDISKCQSEMEAYLHSHHHYYYHIHRQRNHYHHRTEQEGLIREALQTLIDMYPDHVDEFNDLALTSLKEGRFTTAKVAFQLVSYF